MLIRTEGGDIAFFRTFSRRPVASMASRGVDYSPRRVTQTCVNRFDHGVSGPAVRRTFVSMASMG